MSIALPSPFVLTTRPYLGGWLFRLAYPGRLGNDTMTVIFKCDSRFQGLWRAKPDHRRNVIRWHPVMNETEITFSQDRDAAHRQFRELYIRDLETTVLQESPFDL